MELDRLELDALGERTAAFITEYLEGLGGGRVQPPDISPESLRLLFTEPLPLQPQGVAAAFADFQSKVAANSSRVGHPRFMAWIRTSPLAGAIYAEALAATLNQSVAVWDGAPAATEVEVRVIEWLKEICGYAPEAAGLLTSGGSMANFICLQAARSALDPEVRERGLWGAPPMTVYITQETHYCVRKAVEMMGIGRRYLRHVAVDSQFRMDPDDLRRQIRQDQEAGLRPLAVASTLGTVNSGACDDLVALGQVCRELGVWLHVDGAYGGMVALVEDKRPLAAGLSDADSLTCDPHKSLFIPFEAGCALVRNPAHLKAAFATETDYLPNSDCEDEVGAVCPGEPVHFRDYGPQLSRSFRALKIYLTFKIYGVEAIAAAVRRQYCLAARLAERIQAASDFELLAPVPLGIVTFRYLSSLPHDLPDREARLNDLNTRLVPAIQRRGQAFLAGTRLQGQSALRVCIISHRTTEADLDAILDEIRLAGAEL